MHGGGNHEYEVEKIVQSGQCNVKMSYIQKEKRLKQGDARGCVIGQGREDGSWDGGWGTLGWRAAVAGQKSTRGRRRERLSRYAPP